MIHAQLGHLSPNESHVIFYFYFSLGNINHFALGTYFTIYI